MHGCYFEKWDKTVTSPTGLRRVRLTAAVSSITTVESETKDVKVKFKEIFIFFIFVFLSFFTYSRVHFSFTTEIKCN